MIPSSDTLSAADQICGGLRFDGTGVQPPGTTSTAQILQSRIPPNNDGQIAQGTAEGDNYSVCVCVVQFDFTFVGDYGTLLFLSREKERKVLNPFSLSAQWCSRCDGGASTNSHTHTVIHRLGGWSARSPIHSRSTKRN